MTFAKIALVLLHWNNAPDTLECLESLGLLDYPDYEVIVVDNGSTDGSLEKIRAQYPQHTFVENGENLGFAEGNNRGLEVGLKKGADLLMLLNNDTVVAPNMLTEIANAAKEHPEAGVLGPKIFFYDDPATIWYAGGSVDEKTGHCYHIGCGALEGFKERTKTDFICGCALAVRREVLEKVGMLSPEFFLIWEEIDWCYRIRKAGYSCLFVPTARVWHKISSSFAEGNRGPMVRYFYFRNRLLFQKRHFPEKKGLPKGEFLDLLKINLNPKTPPDLRRQYRAAFFGILDHYLGRYGKGRLAKFTQK